MYYLFVLSKCCKLNKNGKPLTFEIHIWNNWGSPKWLKFIKDVKWVFFFFAKWIQPWDINPHWKESMQLGKKVIGSYLYTFDEI